MAPTPDEQRVEQVRLARHAWTTHLVELGGPNTLLWYRDLPVGTIDLTNAHLGARNALVTGAPQVLSDLVREPHALEDARHRAERIHATATRLEREHAIRTCFLGIGTATWKVVLPNGKVAPRRAEAPVFLRACRLVPRDARLRDWTLEPGEDLEVNPALVRYLATEHGVDLDTARLESLATAAGGVDPYPAYAALATACRGVPDLSVVPRVVLSTFPYYKAPLVADLAPADALADDPVVAAMAGHPDALPAVSIGADVSALADDPERDVLVLKADAAQREAVEAVRAGSHLHLRTPPGTGASRTVTNLVAALAGDGKSVLLVSPKRASLDAVRDGLAGVGLDDLVLDLADGGHGRRAAVRTLAEGLDRAAPAAPPPARGRRRDGGRGGPDAAPDPDSRTDRAEAGALLDAHVAALHGRRDPWGTSLHEVQEQICRHARLPAAPRSRVRVDGAPLARLDRVTLADAAEVLGRVARLAAWDDGGGGDPWFGARITSGAEAQEAAERVRRLAEGGVDDARATLGDVFRGIHLPASPTVRDWHRVLSTVGRVRDTLETFRPEVFDIPLGDLVEATASRSVRKETGSDLGVADRWRVRRQARALLRPGRPPADLHAAVVEADAQRHAWRELAGSGGRPEIPVELDRAQEAYDTLLEDLVWLDSRLPDHPGEADLVECDLVTLAARMRRLHAATDRLTPAPQLRAGLDRLEALGLGDLVADLRRREVPAGSVSDELHWVWWCSIADEIFEHDHRVLAHDGPALTAAVTTVREADRAALGDNAARTRRAVAARIERVRRDAPDQEAALRAQAGRTRRPDPLPEVVAQAPDLVTALRPCWMTSPLSVPSVLPPGRTFDVVVVEESSLVAPAEAVAALTRGRQVVLVGDPLQLPPAPFVASAGADAPEDEEATSVLDALDDALPTRRLTWHYRALDERLVAFPDEALYDGGLVTFPGTTTDPVVRHVPVDGHGVVAEGEGAVESTTAEVDRVVDLVLEHAHTRRSRSLLVVALSPGHRRRVEEALRRAVDTVDDATAALFDPTRAGGITVRDTDEVQGEEWDDVIVTVGFGKTPHGRVLHRFGPLATEAGHRRLGVALTRARRTLTVVSTITADDLDPARLRTRGSRMLRELLEHVETHGGSAGLPSAPPGEGRSVVLAELAHRLREHGLTVHEDVGTSATPVGLAVEDPARPGRLLVAVETDGPDYARSASRRDRDRLRAEQLQRRGWTHLRVWSTDVFRDPARDVSRVLAAAGVRQSVDD
ncbi:AAA domain-containing protein [Phycicoccus avicenniae]|uniref:AAA domain-containing protein n=1 Tax=Phycicoccus avicenniae TaxID=2828860 RepID=UPI002010DEE7|nr:AAA domain-containing protein [Phycicoccus avicenniae]